MDEELKRYLDAMQTQLVQQINDGHERILNGHHRGEGFPEHEGLLVSDFLVAYRRRLDLEARVSKLERKEE